MDTVLYLQTISSDKVNQQKYKLSRPFKLPRRCVSGASKFKLEKMLKMLLLLLVPVALALPGKFTKRRFLSLSFPFGSR